MSTEEEESEISLKELVTDALQSNGTLEKIQAQLRASVFLTLEEEFKQKTIPLVNSRTQQLLSSPVGKVAVGIIQDFLKCLGLEFTLAVFTPETNLSSLKDLHEHSRLMNSLGWNTPTQEESNHPVLFRLIEAIQQQRPEADSHPTIQTQASGTIKDDSNEAYVDKSQKQLSNCDNVQLTSESNGESNRIPEKLNSDPVISKLDSSVHDKISNENNDRNSGNVDKNPQVNEEMSEEKSTSISNGTLEDENSISGSQNVYEDEFSASTETEKTNQEEEHEKVSEDVEEEFSMNDILTTESEVSEDTKDVTASENYNRGSADYQESL